MKRYKGVGVGQRKSAENTVELSSSVRLFQQVLPTYLPGFETGHTASCQYHTHSSLSWLSPLRSAELGKSGEAGFSTGLRLFLRTEPSGCWKLQPFHGRNSPKRVQWEQTQKDGMQTRHRKSALEEERAQACAHFKLVITKYI